MPNGAFALYVDLPAGSGGGAVPGGAANQPIDRVIPLPRLGNGHLEFDDRRLTLSYDNVPVGNAVNPLHVTGHFLGTAAPSPIDVNVNGGHCLVLEVPRDACAASLHVEPVAGKVRGPLSALVEYRDQ